MWYRLLVLGFGFSLTFSTACGDGDAPAGADDGDFNESDESISTDEDDDADEDGGGCQTTEELFEAVQPSLNTCRVCHVPGGVAAEAKPPALFMLSRDKSEDFANLKASWEKLGGDRAPVSRILVKAAGGDEHTGGALWSRDSAAYKNMASLLTSLADPEACVGTDGNGTNEFPLLGSSHGGSPLYDFCEGKSDSTKLPPDPRSFVQPGVSDGKAVYFNAFWKDCHIHPELVGELPQATTCGELRVRVDRGAVLMEGNGAIGSGALFSGSDPFSDIAAGFGTATLSSEMFNQLWEVWGLSERPDNFDELVAQRYGAGFGPERNPYPLPGEDPNETDGGSGRLSIFFSQLHKNDGSWSGRIGITCHGCHSGEVGRAEDGEGLGVTYGSGSNLHDYNLFLRDMLPLGYVPSIAMIANLNRTRGTSNASAINMAFFLQEDYGEDEAAFLSNMLGLLSSGSTAGMDTPAWWNLGHRPHKFVDGIFPTDASRVDLVFYTPFAGLFGQLGGSISRGGQDWMRKHAQDANEFISSLKAPVYPYEIDEELAAQGAVLFHSKDLWAEDLNNPVPVPEGGNGSCASCHGAYSPRFANDPAYLETPALEGVASFIVPLEVIGTDPVRTETNNDAVQVAGSNNFFGYPETKGTEQECGMQNLGRDPGYLAPPLYGVWATAPYLHNGSVPNLWEVLKPSERKFIWRRVSTPAREDQVGKVVMGFDTDLNRAFDRERNGWKYDVIECGTNGLEPGTDCVEGKPDEITPIQRALALLYDNIVGTWNLLYPPITSDEQIEGRKIYNTHEYAQGNQGHAFTAVLTDKERMAIMEYLKTL